MLIAPPRITLTQSRTQFSFWCLIAAPLIISSDLRTLDPSVLETYSNAEAIAISQDSLGAPGVRVVGHHLFGKNGSVVNVWARPLSNGDVAVGFINNSPDPLDIACDVACWAAVWHTQQTKPQPKLVNLYDIWLHATVGRNIPTDKTWTVTNVPADGGSFMFLVSHSQVSAGF